MSGLLTGVGDGLGGRGALIGKGIGLVKGFVSSLVVDFKKSMTDLVRGVGIQPWMPVDGESEGNVSAKIYVDLHCVAT